MKLAFGIVVQSGSYEISDLGSVEPSPNPEIGTTVLNAASPSYVFIWVVVNRAVSEYCDGDRNSRRVLRTPRSCALSLRVDESLVYSVCLRW